jgi:hypothetical protein
MILVNTGKRKIECKSNWDELTKDDLCVYVEVFYDRFDEIFGTSTSIPSSASGNEEDDSDGYLVKDSVLFDEARIAMLRRLMKCSGKVFFSLKKEIIWELLYEHNVTNFLFFEPMAIGRNPVPTIDTSTPLSDQLYGPVDNFNVITVAEFALLDMFYLQWKEASGTSAFDSAQPTPLSDRSSEYLDLFLAVMYRPEQKGFDPMDPKWNGDRREDFSKHNIDKRLPSIWKMKAKYKRLPLLWFESERAKWPRMFPDLFEESGSGGQDWLKVVLDMSNDKFGTFAETEATPIKYFLKEMNSKMEDYHRMKVVGQKTQPQDI